jgi:hypothetical protein
MTVAPTTGLKFRCRLKSDRLLARFVSSRPAAIGRGGELPEWEDLAKSAPTSRSVIVRDPDGHALQFVGPGRNQNQDTQTSEAKGK